MTLTFRNLVATILVNTADLASGSATRWLASHQSSLALMVVLFSDSGRCGWSCLRANGAHGCKPDHLTGR